MDWARADKRKMYKRENDRRLNVKWKRDSNILEKIRKGGEDQRKAEATGLNYGLGIGILGDGDAGEDRGDKMEVEAKGTEVETEGTEVAVVGRGEAPLDGVGATSS
jgi:hypothetical protein